MTEARQLASEWHAGQTDPLYGFASTGDLDAWGLDLIRAVDFPVASASAEERAALTQLAEFARDQATHYVCIGMPGCLPNSEAEPCWSLRDAIDRVIYHVEDFASSARFERTCDDAEMCAWDSAKAHAEAYRDADAYCDVPYVELPDSSEAVYVVRAQ